MKKTIYTIISLVFMMTTIACQQESYFDEDRGVLVESTEMAMKKPVPSKKGKASSKKKHDIVISTGAFEPVEDSYYGECDGGDHHGNSVECDDGSTQLCQDVTGIMSTMCADNGGEWVD